MNGIFNNILRYLDNKNTIDILNKIRNNQITVVYDSNKPDNELNIYQLGENTMSRNVTIKIGDKATINRVVYDVNDCPELEQFFWVDVDDVTRSLILYGKYDMSMGDTRITIQ